MISTNRTRRIALVFLIAIVCVVVGTDWMASVRAQPGQASASGPLVVRLKIRDEVAPLMAEYIDRGLDAAAQNHASLVLISMDTPGGLSDSMQQIIQHILQSPVPVAVFVEPTGSRAASAGFFILLSADVAAMAPGTHAGAASPVIEVGGYPITIDETLKRKILNDATAFLRSYAGARGRNVELAETAVTDAKAFTETECLDGKLIDLIASSEDDLLHHLDGRTIKRFNGSMTTLHLANAQNMDFDLTAREKFLSRIVQPDIFFVLLLAGALGLYVEFTHPGMILPGVIGGICVILVLYSAQLLPVNVTGVLLILLALGMFIAEAKFTSHGVLAVGGIVSMLLGALMLIRSPLTSAGVSLAVALGATVPFALIVIILMRLVLKSRAWKQTTGVEELVGEFGEVTQPLVAAGDSSAGMVRVHGELWRAHAAAPIAAGARVRVLSVHGLTLEVEPAP
ncbi:MAG TPA: nodulation protein NfeD [Candidatus Acidoferrales bacterium]|nr:nodulation protein NfeD [Candidatus Acidoferrales bacterium]